MLGGMEDPGLVITRFKRGVGYIYDIYLRIITSGLGP